VKSYFSKGAVIKTKKQLKKYCTELENKGKDIKCYGLFKRGEELLLVSFLYFNGRLFFDDWSNIKYHDNLT